jgi:hypothetical protein
MFIPQINYEQSQRDRQFTHTQNSSATPKHSVRLLGKSVRRARGAEYIKVQAGVLYLSGCLIAPGPNTKQTPWAAFWAEEAIKVANLTASLFAEFRLNAKWAQGHARQEPKVTPLVGRQ